MTDCALTDHTPHPRTHPGSSTASPGSWSSTTIYRCGTSFSRFSRRADIAQSAHANAEEAVKNYASERPAAVLLEIADSRAHGRAWNPRGLQEDRPRCARHRHVRARSHDLRRAGDEAGRFRFHQQAILGCRSRRAAEQCAQTESAESGPRGAARATAVTFEASSPAPRRQPGDG